MSWTLSRTLSWTKKKVQHEIIFHNFSQIDILRLFAKKKKKISFLSPREICLGLSLDSVTKIF